MGGCLLLGRGQYEQYETSTKPVRKSSEGRAKKQIVPYGTYSYEDLFLNVHVLSPRDDGVLGGGQILPDHSLQAAFTCNPACAYYGASTIGRVPNKTPGPAWIVR